MTKENYKKVDRIGELLQSKKSSETELDLINWNTCMKIFKIIENFDRINMIENLQRIVQFIEPKNYL